MIMIIDGMHAAYRAYYAYMRLQNNGKPVNIVYGLPSITHALFNQFKPDDVYICWDAGRHKERLRILPDYKGGRRTKTKEQIADMDHQLKVVRDLYSSLGIKQFIQPGMEADDWIYALVRKFRGEKIMIVSGDKDFNQLLSPTVKIYNPSNAKLIHTKNVKAIFGYTAEQCVDYLSLLGDSSDNIPGYRGMGEERIKIFLSEYASIKVYLESGEQYKNLDNEKLRLLYRKNRKLINLRVFYNLFLKGKLKLNIPTPTFNKKAFFTICDNYNIKKFKTEEFIKIYKKK